MKQIMVVLLIGASCGIWATMASYTQTVDNRSSHPIAAKMEYVEQASAFGKCRMCCPDTRPIAAGKSVSIDTTLCTVSQVTVTNKTTGASTIARNVSTGKANLKKGQASALAMTDTNLASSDMLTGNNTTWNYTENGDGKGALKRIK